MKKIISIIAVISLVFTFTACGGGNVDNVKVSDWEPSEIYTDNDIKAAIQTVKAYFKQEFEGCTLTEIGYVGDAFSDEFIGWAERYNADEAIILYSSFDVDASGADGSLEPNSTYDRWTWILIRDANGTWKHVDHGYG